jgi:drug/metabolite transporter (DMT)-like permease
LALLALGPQLLGHSTFNWALRHLPATKVSILILGEPVGAALLAYLVFGETLTWQRGLGAAIILIGIYVSLSDREVTHGTRTREDRVGS